MKEPFILSGVPCRLKKSLSVGSSRTKEMLQRSLYTKTALFLRYIFLQNCIASVAWNVNWNNKHFCNVCAIYNFYNACYRFIFLKRNDIADDMHKLH